jgi:transcriptional regulator with XRE-family HTH domain
MSIHEQIKRRREAKGWSHATLAAKVSELEGAKKPLAWQTVQQWENGGSAPKRTRLGYVAKALGCTESDLLFGEGAAVEANRNAIIDKIAQAITEMAPSIGAAPSPLIDPEREELQRLRDWHNAVFAMAEQEPVKERAVIAGFLSRVNDALAERASVASAVPKQPRRRTAPLGR